ncbi:MAG: hypothetical protein ACRC8S_10155 [Fimbriiglobus sp.]
MDARSVRVAAYFRALGQSWDQIAMGMGVNAFELEGLPVTNPVAWQMANEEFEPIILRDAKYQAIAAAKLQVRSTNEAISQKTTLAMLKYDVEVKKLAVKREEMRIQEEKAKQAEAKAKAKAAKSNPTPPQAPPQAPTSEPAKSETPAVADKPNNSKPPVEAPKTQDPKTQVVKQNPPAPVVPPAASQKTG